ncbi:hypothetical protein OAV88_00905 [bacterium]|nr:hypothetical protein [bacterium]
MSYYIKEKCLHFLFSLSLSLSLSPPTPNNKSLSLCYNCIDILPTYRLDV